VLRSSKKIWQEGISYLKYIVKSIPHMKVGQIVLDEKLLSTVTVAPVTSTIRGVPSEVVLNEEDGMKSPCAVNLHNAVTVSQQRLGRRVAQLSAARMNEVCAALRFSLGCDSH